MKLKKKFILLAVLCLATPLLADDGYIILKNQRTLDQIQRIYSEMPPIRYTPPSDRWRNIAFGSDGTMYVATTTVNKNVEAKEAAWGHPSAEIVLLVSKDRGQTFRVF